MTTQGITWDYNGLANNANFFGTQRDWNNTIMSKINLLCGEFIQQFKIRPNFIGAGPELISIIEDQTSFFYTTPDVVFDDSKDLIPIGSLKNRYSVWESIDMAGKPYLYMGRISEKDVDKINEIGLKKFAVVNKFPTMEVLNINAFR